MQILKNRKATGYIDGAVMVIAFLLLVMVIIYTTQLVVLHQRIDSLCDNLLETATAYGQFGAEYEQLLQEARQEYSGLSATTSSNGQVQFGERMELILTLNVQVPVFGNLSVPVTIRVSKYGLSEKFWK